MNSAVQYLEINLISAQGLKSPTAPLHHSMQCYAVVFADQSAKVRTLTDLAGGSNPTWNDRFVFRVPASLLHADSASPALTVHLYAAATSWCGLRDTLLGTVRLLLSNQRLLDRPPDTPSFIAVAVRRPSGRFHGMLNIAATRLSHVSSLAAEALVERPAVSYRDIMAPRKQRRRAVEPLKELNREVVLEKKGWRRVNLGGADEKVPPKFADENVPPPC